MLGSLKHSASAGDTASPQKPARWARLQPVLQQARGGADLLSGPSVPAPLDAGGS